MKNIVWICTDQQRADSLGCMGNRHAETPALDALAAGGTLLTRLISAHPVCMPSRASMLTGCHPPRHGVITNGIPLPQRSADDHERKGHVPTMAEHLRDHGYHTRCIGKLHLEPHQAAEQHGFRESYAMWASGRNEDWHGPLFGFDHLELSESHGGNPGGRYIRWLRREHPAAAAKLEDRANWPARPCSLGDLQATPIAPEQSCTMWVAQAFGDFLHQRRTDDRPFFCWLGIPDPHHPWHPPQELAERFANRDFMPPAPEKMDDPPGLHAPKPHKRQDGLATYADGGHCLAMVRRYTEAQNALIDRAVAAILAALEAAGLRDDTVICFTSDHGDYLGDYGRIGKNSYCCTSLNHIPGIIHDPAGSLPDRITGVCGQVDLAPTLCRAAGVPWQVPDGRSLQDGCPERAFSLNLSSLSPNLSLWTDHERFAYHPLEDFCEYYDHREDPQELRNRAADFGERCAQLRACVMRKTLCSSASDTGRYSTW